MMKYFIFFIVILFSFTSIASEYDGEWTGELRSCKDQYFPKGKMKLIISNGKAELAHYGYKSDFKAADLNKFKGKVKKKKIGMNGYDGNISGKFTASNRVKLMHFWTTGKKSCEWELTRDGSGSVTETKPTKVTKKFNTSSGIQSGSQEDLIVNVGDRIFFNYDSSEIDSDAQELLQDQAAWLNQYPRVRITIEGHADERSTFNYALAIGDKRAIAVKNYLVSLGVDNSRISTISFGYTRPAVIGSNDGAWAQNRRAVTIVD